MVLWCVVIGTRLHNRPHDLYAGLTAFTTVVFVVNAKLALYMNTWTLVQAGVFALSIFVYFAFILLYGAVVCKFDTKEMCGVSLNLLGQPAFWLVLFFAASCCLIYDFAWMALERFFAPRNYQIVQYLQHDVKDIAKRIEAQKPIPKRLRTVQVLEMARSLEGVDPAVPYSGYAYSGTKNGRTTLALMSGDDPRKIKF